MDPDDDSLKVNCGKCGKSLVVRFSDILGKRIVECTGCRAQREHATRLSIVLPTNKDASG